MRNQDYYGNRGDFQGQRRDRDQSALGRGMDRLGQMGKNLMGGMRHRDERTDQRRYADDFEGRNRYTEWQNRYSLGQNRQDMQPQYGRQDQSQYDYGDRYSDMQGRFGSEQFDQDEDYGRYETNDRFNEDFDRYGGVGRGQSGFSQSYSNDDQSNYYNSNQGSSMYEPIPHAFSAQRYGIEGGTQFRQPQQFGNQSYASQPQQFGQGQGLSSQYGAVQSQQWGRSSPTFDRESSALGARTQSMFAGRGPRGYQRSDDRIMEDVCEALMHHPQIDASEIEVKVTKGEVMLLGSVDNRQAKRLAEDVIESISGVREVKNELRVTNNFNSMFQNRQNQGVGQSQGQQNLGVNQSSSNLSTQGGSDYNLSPITSSVGTSPTSQGTSGTTGTTGTTGTSGATSAASGRGSESRSLS